MAQFREAGDVDDDRYKAQGELDRRQFIGIALTLASSAMFLGSTRLLDGEEPAAAVPSYAALRSLPPGAVRPEGWLRSYLERDASQLGSKLTQVSTPFNKAYWAGEETAESWWPWEQKAYWLDGASRLALVLQDEQLMAQVRTSIDYTLTHATPGGYFGPKFIESPKEDFHRWPHALFMRSLSALSDSQMSQQREASENIVAAVQKFYLSDKASYATPIRNVINLESILWCYERTGDPQLLALAEKTWQDFMTVAGDHEHGDLSALSVYAAGPIDAHGVTYAEVAKQPAILYRYTGKEEYLRFALAAQRRIFDHHMLIDGIPSTSEIYRTVTSLDSHETCNIADHTWSWGHMLQATGDAVWADRVERACFNAGAGAIKNDWKALQYFSCPNQFLATLNSDHNVMEHGGFLMAYQPNPGKAGACCGGNVHRIFPNYVMRMWMKSDNGGLAAVLYGPSTVKTRVGTDNQPIEIVQTTHYPFDEQIHFKVNTDRAVSFPLSLRIPAWCDKPHLTINGATAVASRTTHGFLVVHRKFNPGDELTLTLPMKLAVTRWPQNGIGVERGPLVYSLPIKEKWEPRVEPIYTTAEFPSWEVTPQSEWNYGLALDPAKLESEIEVTRRPLTESQADDPWENPSTTLTLTARKIDGWALQANPDDPSQKFTPPLPDLSATEVSKTTERVSLIPYGSTHLRLTIFPAVRV